MRISPTPREHLPENPGVLSPEQKRGLVQRVLQSPTFSRSQAMRAFLLYITEQTISGRADRLKEQVIGAQVLGRRPNYDPAEDNIVRVRAHELRGRLEKHFATDGREESVVITIPKGSYVPEFVPRKAAPIAVETSANYPNTPTIDALANTTIHPAAQAAGARRTRLGVPFWAFLTTAFLIGVAASFILPRSSLRKSASAPQGAIRDFWGQFFNRPNEELKIVYADTSFALWQDLNVKTLDLGDYLSHNYPGAEADRLLEVAERRATSPADIHVSVRLAVLAGLFGGQVSPQFARNVNAEFLQRGNVILLGSHRSNPWVEVYEPSLNFKLEQDRHSGAPLFRNRAPQIHEAPVYAIPAMLDAEGAEKREFISYGVVALLKGCGDRGLIVLDEGLNMQATQAGGDFLTDSQKLDALLRSIGHKPGTNVASFEALYQITSLPGGYDNPKVIAYRLRPAESCVGD